MLFASLAILIAGASSVRAHGYVQTVDIAGQTYQAWHPFADPYSSPAPTTVVRKVADDGPITFDSTDLTCNKGGNTGNGVTATVAAGQDITWTMSTWPDDHHGPITVYMANCGDDCESFDGTGNTWFKLSSEGLIDAASFYWASDKLIANGKTWTSTVPSNIKPGKYLIRLELLALHSAGAPQFYPSCTQLDITGSGTGAPTTSELVSIPGVYKEGDEALFGSIWQQPTSWPQVGPDVAAFVSGGGSSGSSSSSSQVAVASSTTTHSSASSIVATSAAASTSTAGAISSTAANSSASASASSVAPTLANTTNLSKPEATASSTETIKTNSSATRTNQPMKTCVHPDGRNVTKREYMRGCGKWRL